MIKIKFHPRLGGFTLIELILGLAIFAIVALIISGTFWGGIQLSRRSQTEKDTFGQMRLSLDLLSREIENMVPYDCSASYPKESTFEGKEKEIRFVSATPKGLKAVRYYLVDPAEGHVHEVLVGATYQKNVKVTSMFQKGGGVRYLVRQETDLMDYLNATAQDDTPFEIIATNIRPGSLRFAYGYTEGNGQGYTWETGWQEAYLPAAVRVQMDFMTADGSKTFPVEERIFVPDGKWGKKKL